MNTQNLVSIVTPCYNGEKTIQDTILSVLNQTYTHWELLIIDDCSTDSSEILIHNFSSKDSRIKYLKTNLPSGSPTLPRNIGIENAKGRFIAFLDCDDIWLPTKLEEQIPFFNDSHTAIVFSNYEKITENGKRNNRIIIAPKQATYKQLLNENIIGCLTAIYDTQKIGKVYFSKIGHEDYAMWLSILKKGYIAKNTNSKLALYRVNKHSTSSNKIKAFKWTWYIYRDVEHLPLYKSIYYFINYAFRAGYKFLK